MNNKILIGSIIAVTVLIGVSFTSVVGYNSVKSDVNASPLFNIRTSRAIDEESEDLSCEYVGKGYAFPIPQKDSKTISNEKLQWFIDVVNNMEDKELERFIALIIFYIQRNNRFEHKEIEQIKNTLYQLFKYPDLIYLLTENIENEPPTWPGFNCECTFSGEQPNIPSCILLLILEVFYVIVGTLALILSIFTLNEICNWEKPTICCIK